MSRGLPWRRGACIARGRETSRAGQPLGPGPAGNAQGDVGERAGAVEHVAEGHANSPPAGMEGPGGLEALHFGVTARGAGIEIAPATRAGEDGPAALQGGVIAPAGQAHAAVNRVGGGAGQHRSESAYRALRS